MSVDLNFWKYQEVGFIYQSVDCMKNVDMQ